MSEYSFPPEFVNPKDKELAEYGLRAAEAMYYSDNRYGSKIFYEDDYFDNLTEVCQGNQSVEPLRKLFGFHRPAGSSTGDGPDSLAFIDPKVLNLGPKYVNRAVAKMQRVNFDIGLDAIDLRSIDEKEDYKGVINAVYKLKDFVNTMGIPLQAAFEGVDVSSLPDYPDELLHDINTNPKLQREIEGELTIKLIHSINRFRQKMREIDWDLVVHGFGHVHCYHDANWIPRIDRINPKYWGGSYVDNDDFEDQEYSFFLECITVNQFIKEASPFYKQSELEEIAARYRLRNSSFSSNNFQQSFGSFDNLDYIPVMRFYFLSEDQNTFVSRKNQYGSKILIEKNFNYQPNDSVLDRFGPKGDSKLLQPSYTSVYGGTWIVDSDNVYNYGRKPYPRTNLVNASLPIKTFATNFKNGRPVSFAAQMIEPMFMINAMWNKIKGDLARGWTGIREIDFSALEGVAMGRGGKVWDAREVYEFMEMTQTVASRGKVNQYDQRVGDTVKFHESGVKMADYFNTIQTSLMFLEQMTGTTLAESSETPNRLAVGVMKASQFAGDLDMEYLYNAHEYLFERVSHQSLLLAQETKRRKKQIRGFIPALRMVHEAGPQLAYTEFGMTLTRQPGPEEWADFYQDVREALAQQRIGISDSMYLREIDNLKQARQTMISREAAHDRKVQKMKDRDMENQMEANAQSAEAKSNYEMGKIKAKKDADKELAILQGKIDQMLQQDKSEQDAVLASVDKQMKTLLQKQKGRDDIMKQALKNIPEKGKNDVAMKRIDKMPVPAKNNK